MIAIVGMGLLGSNFARALLKKGERVQVWNRTFERARALEAEGRSAFADAAEAVRGADARAHRRLGRRRGRRACSPRRGCRRAALVIDHTTTSTAGSARAHGRARDITYVHAPVFMGPQNALESTGIMLLSGDRARVERVKPLVTPMTGKVIDLGERPDAAAAFKLMGNTFLMAFTAGIGDMLGLGQGAAASRPTRRWRCSSTSTRARSRCRAREAHGRAASYAQPSWELAMARKDARLVEERSRAANVTLTLDAGDRGEDGRDDRARPRPRRLDA